MLCTWIRTAQLPRSSTIMVFKAIMVTVIRIYENYENLDLSTAHADQRKNMHVRCRSSILHLERAQFLELVWRTLRMQDAGCCCHSCTVNILSMYRSGMGIRDLRPEYLISNEYFFRSDQLQLILISPGLFVKIQKKSNSRSFESESPSFFRPQQPEFIICFAISNRLLIIDQIFRIRLKTIIF
jgi:hypothetical protein